MTRSLSFAAAAVCAIFLTSTNVEAGGCLFSSGASYGPGYFTSYYGGGGCGPCDYNPVNYGGVAVSNYPPAHVATAGACCDSYYPATTCGTHCPTYTACPTTTCGHKCRPRRGGCFLGRGLFGGGCGLFSGGCGSYGSYGYGGCGCGW